MDNSDEKAATEGQRQAGGAGSNGGAVQGATPAAERQKASTKVPLIIGAVLLALGVGGYFFWKSQKGGSSTGGTSPGGMASSGQNKASPEALAGVGIDKALEAALVKAGVSGDALVAAVGTSPALVAKAKEVLAGRTAAGDHANALWALGQGWLKAKNLRPGFEELLRKQIVRASPRAFDDFQAGAPGEAYALEVAGALLALARAGQVSAFGFELATGGGKIRSEASAQLANIGVAVYPAGDLSAKPFVIDVGAGAVTEGPAGRRLEDAQLAAHFYVARAGYFFLRSEGTKANRESEWAMKLDEASPSVAASRGMVLMAFGQIDQAVTQVKRAAERGGAAGRWQVMLCLSLLRAERGDDAIAACKKGVEREPGATGAHLALGYAYLALGEADKALETVEVARKLDDADAEVHKALAQIFDQKGDRDKAKASLAQALRLDPKVRGVHLLRGLMAMKDMDYEGAAEGLRKEVEVDPENERLRAILATTLFRGGKKPEAEKVLAEMGTLSKDPAITAQLVASVRKELAEDEDDEKTDGGADDEDEKSDGGTGTGGTGTGGPGTGGPGTGGTAGGPQGTSAPGAGVPATEGAPRVKAAAEDKDDEKDDDKDDGKDEPAPKSSTGFDLQKPGEAKSAPRLFDLGKKP